MSKTLKAGIITTHISPALGYGGPAVSVAKLVNAWAAKKGRSLIVCSSDESTGARLKETDVYRGEQVHVRLYRAQIFRRWGFGLNAFSCIWQTCKESDAVYINGIGTWPTTLAALACSLLKKRFVIALRGGLMPEYVTLVRNEKPHKWLYHKLFTFPTLRRASYIHCTSNIEAKSAMEVCGNKVRCAIVPNGVAIRTSDRNVVPSGPGLVICYAGRISQEKGINGFIKEWLKCKDDNDQLIVAGTGFGKYYDEFKSLVAQANCSISDRGYLDQEGLFDAISESHFLVLPSGLEAADVRENFGNTVAEALAAGRPALTTRGLVWDDLESANAGFVFDREPAAARAAIIRAKSTTLDQRRSMAQAARKYAENHIDIAVLSEKVWDTLQFGDPKDS